MGRSHLRFDIGMNPSASHSFTVKFMFMHHGASVGSERQLLSTKMTERRKNDPTVQRIYDLLINGSKRHETETLTFEFKTEAVTGSNPQNQNQDIKYTFSTQ